MTKQNKDKVREKIEKQIIEILSDTEHWQPEMIIEEKEPFWWRLNPFWLKTKAIEIGKLLKQERRKAKLEILEELIEVFRKHRKEPMTGNVVLLELKGRKYRIGEEK